MIIKQPIFLQYVTYVQYITNQATSKQLAALVQKTKVQTGYTPNNTILNNINQSNTEQPTLQHPSAKSAIVEPLFWSLCLPTARATTPKTCSEHVSRLKTLLVRNDDD